MPHKVFYVFAALALAASASAQTLVGGEGKVSCGTYLDHRRTGNEAQHYIYVVWIRGFSSGFNYGTKGKQVSSGLEKETILAYIDKHCRDNPLNSVAGAAFNLVKELGGMQ